MSRSSILVLRLRYMNTVSTNNGTTTGNSYKKNENGMTYRRKKTILSILQKSTRKDTNEEGGSKDVLKREISDCLEMCNNKEGSSLTYDDIKVGIDVIDKFIFSKDRPQVILNDVEVVYLTSEGYGLALVNKSKYLKEFNTEENGAYTVVLIPKTLPGDKVTVQLIAHSFDHAESILLSIDNKKEKANRRRDELVVCGNFQECNACQYQMLDYNYQLELKQSVIQKAYKFFYPEVFKHIPQEDLGNVVASPMEYSYRTKITPHYTYRKGNIENIKVGFKNVNPTKGNIDVLNCPIATESINEELIKVRARVKNKLAESSPNREQSTVLLRESIRVDFKTGNYDIVCITDPKAIVTEKVDDFVFQFPANEFFQNNNSILLMVIDYIRFHLEGLQFKHIVDTYCGSGFFGLSLSRDIPEDGRVFGIEVSATSLKYASHNAKINGLQVPEKMQFIEGSSEKIFTNEDFLNSNVKGHESVVIMDPSRKGSNKEFLTQLLEFKPKLIVYVSCNVFTQARDISTFMKLQEDNPIYELNDITGFDFFPQTKHVESIAILKLKD